MPVPGQPEDARGSADPAPAGEAGATGSLARRANGPSTATGTTSLVSTSWSAARDYLRDLGKWHFGLAMTAVAAPLLLRLFGYRNGFAELDHFLITLSAMALVHLLEKYHAFRTTQKALAELRSDLLVAADANSTAVIKNVQEEMTTSHGRSMEAVAGELRRAFRLIECEGKCGVDAMWDRRDQAVVEEIAQAIDAAERRVWITAVVFTGQLDLDRRFTSIKKKVDAGLDVRIALMDPTSVAACLRIAVESVDGRQQEMSSAIKTRLTLTAFQSAAVWREYGRTAGLLAQHAQEALTNAFRYYTHNPSCFLVIVDDAAYYQPYSFGYARRNAGEEKLMGLSMPVWRFSAPGAPQSSGESVFATLEDHFRSTWILCPPSRTPDSQALQRIQAYGPELVRAVDHRHLKQQEFGSAP